MTFTGLFIDSPRETRACSAHLEGHCGGGRHGKAAPPRAQPRKPREIRESMTLSLLAMRDALHLAVANGALHHDFETRWLQHLTDDERFALGEFDDNVARLRNALGDKEAAPHE